MNGKGRTKGDRGKFALLETALNARKCVDSLEEDRTIACAKKERVSGLRYNW